jgi:lipopolysaccharide biosynthesis regulator YciM
MARGVRRPEEDLGLRKSDDRLVLGHLQAKLGEEAAAADKRDAAEAAFRAALSLDRRVLPAYLGLAALYEDRDAPRAAAFLEEAIEAAPDRAYLSFEPLERAYAAAGQPSRFANLCERLIDGRPRDWRARLALARHLAARGELGEALGLTLRALEANPQVLVAHVEAWRILRRLGLPAKEVERYIRVAEEAVFYRDPHVCTACRYRADSMLWRCPHCHGWDTLVEERIGPPVPSR